jgi:very-short-patch-repair endonuclease
MNTATPSLRATPSEEGERIPNAENSPSFEGVARSDGVAAPAPESATSHKLNELPYNPALKQRAKELRKAGNLSEALFWNAVKNRQFNDLDFDRQRVIGNYIVDFYCFELALVIEIDGSSHDDKQEYDLARDQYLEALGLKVCHVPDTDVKTNLEGVLALVRQQIQLPRPLGTPSNEGEFSVFGICSPSSEGVARSDGVAALKIHK